MAHPYTEDQLVEQPAIGLFAALGWQIGCSVKEVFGWELSLLASGNHLPRLLSGHIVKEGDA